MNGKLINFMAGERRAGRLKPGRCKGPERNNKIIKPNRHEKNSLQVLNNCHNSCIKSSTTQFSEY